MNPDARSQQFYLGKGCLLRAKGHTEIRGDVLPLDLTCGVLVHTDVKNKHYQAGHLKYAHRKTCHSYGLYLAVPPSLAAHRRSCREEVASRRCDAHPWINPPTSLHLNLRSEVPGRGWKGLSLPGPSSRSLPLQSPPSCSDHLSSPFLHQAPVPCFLPWSRLPMNWNLCTLWVQTNLSSFMLRLSVTRK